MSDVWEICKQKRVACGSIRREMELVKERHDEYFSELMEIWPDVMEECEELEGMFDDFWDNIAEALKSLGAEAFGNLIEIMQCGSALNTFSNYHERVQVLQDELETLAERLEDAEQEYAECVHKFSK